MKKMFHVLIITTLFCCSSFIGCMEDSAKSAGIALCKAVYDNDIEGVNNLLNSGANPNMLGDDIMTPLNIAAQEGHTDIVKLLLTRSDIKVNLKDLNNESVALMYAAYEGHSDIVKLLLADSDIQVNVQGNNRNTALICAAGKSNSGIVKLLLERPDIQVNLQNNNGRTALHTATTEGHSDIVKLLLERPDIQVNLQTRNPGTTPLMNAAYRDHYRTVKFLLDHPDIQINLQDDNGFTALMLAAKKGHNNIVKLLIDAKADVNKGSKDGGTALYFAMGNNHDNIGKRLIYAGAKIIQANLNEIIPIKNGDYSGLLDYVTQRMNKQYFGSNKKWLEHRGGREMDIVSKEALQNYPKIECSLCLETKSGTECHIMDCWKIRPTQLECICCKECLIELIAYHLKDKKSTHELTCPNQKCMQKINASDIYAITQDPNGLYKDFLDVLFTEFKINNQSQIKSCPTPNCESTYILEDDDATKCLACLDCKQSYCGSCQYNHKGITCQEAAALDHDCPDCATRHARNITCEVAARNRAEAETEDLTNLDTQQFKRCPNCKVLIEKIRGCNHMTCGQCHHEFCWICLSKYGTTECSPTRCAVFDIRTGIFGGLINF